MPQSGWMENYETLLIVVNNWTSRDNFHSSIWLYWVTQNVEQSKSKYLMRVILNQSCNECNQDTNVKLDAKSLDAQIANFTQSSITKLCLKSTVKDAGTWFFLYHVLDLGIKAPCIRAPNTKFGSLSPVMQSGTIAIWNQNITKPTVLSCDCSITEEPIDSALITSSNCFTLTP